MLGGRWSRFLVYRLVFLCAGNIGLLVGIYLLLDPGASFSQVVSSSSRYAGPVILAGLGLTGIISAGAIDLSIGTIVSVAGSVFGVLVYHSYPPVVCFAACFLSAFLLSMWNGYMIRLIRVPAIIVTLAGLTFYRGVALIIADIGIENFSGNITVQDPAYQGPGLAYPGTLLLVGVAAAAIFGAYAKTPRTWLALGDSSEACRLQGLEPGRILQSAFLVSGLLLGAASVLQVTQLQAIEPARLALGFELKVVGAVVLGGTNIFGGEGSYAGTVLGALFLFFLEQILLCAGVSPYYRDVISGATILLFIGVDCYLGRRRKLREELR